MHFLFFSKIFLTGAIVLALELVASSIMTPFFGVSINVWASILSITLIGLAVGYKLGGYLSGYFNVQRLNFTFIISGAICGLWLNLVILTYPLFIPAFSSLGLVLGSFLTCCYILLLPLVVYSSLNTILVGIFNSLDNGDKKSANISGTVFFVSTLGSVLGVFVAAYLLLENFSSFTSYGLLACFSTLLSLLLASVSQALEKSLKLTAICLSVLALFAGLMLLVFLQQNKKVIMADNGQVTWKVVAQTPSFYGKHIVVDYINQNGSTWRGLLTNGLINNRINVDGTSASIFPYVLQILSNSTNKTLNSALVLGLGTGVIPAQLSNLNVDVDVVELDAKVLEIAKAHFGYSEKMGDVHVQDARTFVKNCQKNYDTVIIDLFQGDGIPEHVVTEEFFNDVWSCLSNEGTISMNFFYSTNDIRSKNSLLKSIVSKFDKLLVFEEPNLSGTIAQGYILAKKSNDKWSASFNLKNVKPNLKTRIYPILKNWKAYENTSSELENTKRLTDRNNFWKLISNEADVEYRKRLVKNIPLEILLL